MGIYIEEKELEMGIRLSNAELVGYIVFLVLCCILYWIGGKDK